MNQKPDNWNEVYEEWTNGNITAGQNVAEFVKRVFPEVEVMEYNQGSRTIWIFWISILKPSELLRKTSINRE